MGAAKSKNHQIQSVKHEWKDNLRWLLNVSVRGTVSGLSLIFRLTKSIFEESGNGLRASSLELFISANFWNKT